MRKVLIAAVFVTAMMVDLRPVSAAGPAPWCAVIPMGPGDAYWDCQYRSIEACRPTIIAGNRGFCNPNPGWYGPAEPPRKAGKRRVRRG